MIENFSYYGDLIIFKIFLQEDSFKTEANSIIFSVFFLSTQLLTQRSILFGLISLIARCHELFMRLIFSRSAVEISAKRLF